MRNDFGALILSSRRANRVKTVKSLLDAGYTGKWYIVIDDEEEQAEEYKKNFGDKVVVFHKRKYYDMTDTMDNFSIKRAVVYARNASFDVAKKLNLKYFVQLDDDYESFGYRKLDKRLWKTVLKEIRVKQGIDGLFSAMVEFLTRSNAASISFAQGGDLMGGVKTYVNRLSRKCMNTMFCRTDNPVSYMGTTNEDVTAYVLHGSCGNIFMCVYEIAVHQGRTQAYSGGLTETYLASGTYVKSFYSLMAVPSAVKVGVINSTHPRIHHKINWNYCVPKILNECYKK